MTGSSNGRFPGGAPRESIDLDELRARREQRPVVVRDYERRVRRAEAEAEKARARLAAVFASLG